MGEPPIKEDLRTHTVSTRCSPRSHRGGRCFFISLKDKDPNAADAYVVAPNLNKGNRQIAHGVSQVLRPLDLPPKA